MRVNVGRNIMLINNNKPLQHFGCACALGRVTRYPESCH